MYDSWSGENDSILLLHDIKARSGVAGFLCGAFWYFFLGQILRYFLVLLETVEMRSNGFFAPVLMRL